jgi:adenylate cyclase
MVTSGSAPDSNSIEEWMWGQPPTLTAADVAEAIGVDDASVRRAWRLFGFADPEGAAVFFPADIELVRVHTAATELFGAEPVEHMTRAVGASARNMIEASIAVVSAAFGDLDELPPAEAEQILQAASVLLRDLIHALPALLIHQSRAALGFLGPGGVEKTLAVAFCDLVDSTALANASPTGTARAIAEFETYAADTIAQRAGRLVKFVGDEVMFATSSVDEAHDLAHEVLQWVADHHHLSLARAGIAHGRVHSVDGDLYGPTVNLAARLTALADPDTIVTADENGTTTLIVKGFETAVRVRTTRRA